MTETAPYFQLTLDAPEGDALMIAGALEGFGAPMPQSVSVRRMGRAVPWRIEAIFGEPPDTDALQQFLADIAPGLSAKIEPLAEENWVALSQSKLPPIRTARFYVRNYNGVLPEDLGARKIITIEAGLAFGTGHHASTHGCLLMLEELAKLGFRPRRALDLGAGTALLAIGAHKLWPEAVITASDIDPVAVEVARANARASGAPSIRHMVAPGFRHPALQAAHRFDLVLANILAKPLIRLSREIARHAQSNARLILSGILDEQAAGVIAAYRAAGFSLIKRRDLEGWSTLLMRAPSQSELRAATQSAAFQPSDLVA
ncbi:MAG: 50S ribosomal protein L11 methyltransferase [Alphaproteobacteria bacterium]